MKKVKFKRIIKSTWITFLLIFILFGCRITNKIYEENDMVYSSKRIELKFDYRNHAWRSPITYAEQSIIKEISGKGTIYKVYDTLVLTSLSYQLKDKVFLIIDNEVFETEIDKKEYESTNEINEKKEEIATSDSTSRTVVTGFSEKNRKVTRFSYKLPDKVIEKIKNSDHVLFRYYAGPDMLTLTLGGLKLKKLKKLIDKN